MVNKPHQQTSDDVAAELDNLRREVEELRQSVPEKPRPDLVITDFMMPVLDGAGFLLAMRNTVTQREIPCIVVSSMPERTVRARIDGYAAFVRKPFHLAEVVRLVAAILGASQQAPEDSA